MIATTKEIRFALLLGIGVTLALLVWSYLRMRAQAKVLDASNDPALSALFDALNPSVPGTQPTGGVT